MIKWDNRLDGLKEYVVNLRRDFHAHPELSLEEYRTAGRIEEELDSLGIQHSRVGSTGVLGIVRGTQPGDRVVVLRADTDALAIQEQNDTEYRSLTDGVMHACGHDAHTACLLGAARLLADQRDSFGGEIRLVFQHAEENGRGAKDFLDAGVMEGADRVFGIHTAYNLPAGTVGLKPGLNNASVDHFRIVVHGKASHVSSPQLGADALYIASQIVVSLQALVSRRTSPIQPVIVGVGKLTAGTAYNAVAETAELEGTTRTTTIQLQDDMREWGTEVAERTAELYGGTAFVEWTHFASPVINDPAVCREAARAAKRLDAEVSEDRPLSMGGDDFAEYLMRTPGAYAYLGTSNPGKPHTMHPNHNGSFDIDEDVLPLGAQLYAAYALQTLST